MNCLTRVQRLRTSPVYGKSVAVVVAGAVAAGETCHFYKRKRNKDEVKLGENEFKSILHQQYYIMESVK